MVLKESPSGGFQFQAGKRSSSDSPQSFINVGLSQNTSMYPFESPSIISHRATINAENADYLSHQQVVGDRLTTDVMLANTMGSYSCFLKDGVLGPQKLSFVCSSLRIHALQIALNSPSF